ncbi:RecB family exonuclease [Actinomyces vulturis]|uniref:RecB family exonuclease n=1 Tax=Actinomyces vulturis TaxID=1857645 RepID=UPI0009F4D618|nr:PD-(D/E)XK nuclease family protein [Actinomyces vulturis]
MHENGDTPSQTAVRDASHTGPGAHTPSRARKRRAALSPSRAKDFMQCPLLFRLRTIDHMPEPGSLATHKGTVVHGVLERLYDLPPHDRTVEAAHELLPSQWEAHQDNNPDVFDLFDDPDEVEPWLDEARALLETYFTVENPTFLQPAERELMVEVENESGLLLRGFVDRLDISPQGDMRVVDYKTGKAPSPRFMEDALFQMRFYGLALWRLRGRMPRRLQLIYLRDGKVLTHDPVERDLKRTSAKLDSLWSEIEQCTTSGRFAPRQTKLCDWCAHKALCPLFGGTTPPMNDDGARHLLTAHS